MTTLAPDFLIIPTGDPGWADLHERGPFSHALMIAELRDEAGRRRRTYGKRIDDGRMTQGEAEREIALIGELADRLIATDARAPLDTPQRFTFTDYVRALRREIAMRRTAYPGWIAKDVLTQGEADHRRYAMQGVLHFVWTMGLGMTSRDEAAAHLTAIRHWATANGYDDTAPATQHALDTGNWSAATKVQPVQKEIAHA